MSKRSKRRQNPWKEDFYDMTSDEPWYIKHYNSEIRRGKTQKEVFRSLNQAKIKSHSKYRNRLARFAPKTKDKISQERKIKKDISVFMKRFKKGGHLPKRNTNALRASLRKLSSNTKEYHNLLNYYGLKPKKLTEFKKGGHINNKKKGWYGDKRRHSLASKKAWKKRRKVIK